MMEWLQWIHGTAQPAPVNFGPGDEVRVWYHIVEQGKERLGQFEGTVIRVRGSGAAKTFTVRRVTFGEGVERIFPIDAKTVARIEVLREGHVKRSRLYFLRTLIGKSRIASTESPAADERRKGIGSLGQPTTEASAAAEKHEAAVAALDKPTGGAGPHA